MTPEWTAKYGHLAYPDQPIPGWCDFRWWERLALGTVLSFVAVGMFGGLLLFCGLMMEGQARYYDELASCRKHAETPADHDACR